MANLPSTRGVINGIDDWGWDRLDRLDQQSQTSHPPPKVPETRGLQDPGVSSLSCQASHVGSTSLSVAGHTHTPICSRLATSGSLSFQNAPFPDTPVLKQVRGGRHQSTPMTPRARELSAGLYILHALSPKHAMNSKSMRATSTSPRSALPCSAWFIRPERGPRPRRASE